jgi:putative toxin-antitoxin system antitoxin component (TIGR02293 family)
MPAATPPTASDSSRIAEFMGLPRWRDMDDMDLVARVLKGFPARTAATIVSRIDPEGRFLKVTDIIPKSTLHRREKDNKPLTQNESEKLLALARVFAEVIRIYHADTEASLQFLTRAHPLLGNRQPIELATESIAGTDLVLKILAQADAGIAA